MARPRTKMPAYRHHISGQAVACFNGKDIYLGTHDLPISRAKYHELVQVGQANGFKLPDEIAPHLCGRTVGIWRRRHSVRRLIDLS